MNLRFGKLPTALIAAAIVLALNIVAPVAYSQTITSGDITGTVADSSGAVVPGAKVILKNVDTGDGRSVDSGPDGQYRFTFLKPGRYTVSASTAGLKSDATTVAVAVGQVQTLTLIVRPEEAKEVVMVNDTAPLLQADNANIASTFSTKQLDLLPSPGGDITTAAFTVPGISVSTGGGYGNFSSHGLPGTSNLFTVNGIDNMDPYLNLNNSGASNLTLGANEVQETTIVQNGYTAQYGRQAGAQVNTITKSGANAFHGNLLYTYNGSFMNANDFFNNSSGTPRSRAISNQYGASLGGRIKKDKLFFFVDTEGLRYVLPSAGFVTTPSAALQNYILKTLPAAQVPLYQKAFGLYNTAPGRNRAVSVTNGDGNLQDSNGVLGCGALAGTPTGVGNGVFGTNVSCADAFGTNVSNQNTEWLFTTRVDYNLNDNNKIFVRFKTDHGLQPTSTDPINPIFNAISNQPQYEGDIDYTAILSPRTVNKLTASVNYYSAIFAPADLNATLAAFPTQFQILDGGSNAAGITGLGNNNASFPQGRRVGQIQLVDDFSYIVGKHTLKLGVNYRYNRVTDTGNNTLLQSGRYQFVGLDEFAAGIIDPTTGSNYVQRFTPTPTVHLRLYNVGFYVQDEWAVKPNVKITAGIRLDRTGNPECTDNCYARFDSPFATLQHGASIPYNQSIQTGLSNAFYNVESVVPQPRLGITYNPGWSRNTVIRGGVGLFSDQFPAFAFGGLFSNSPNVFTPTVRTGTVNTGGAGSAPAIALATAQAFQRGFAGGATLAQLQAALAPVAFTPPPYFSIPSTLNNPKYLEWSFEIEHQFLTKNVVTVGYVGNHGYDLFLRNLKVNASASATAYPNGFQGLPTVAPDPRFRIVTDFTNNGLSNYDGLTVSYRRAFGYGFQGQVGYTWSHALDTVSNGGTTLFFSGDSLTSQNDPFSPRRLNYSNADYDIRHNLVSDFLWEVPFKSGNKAFNTILGGWSVSGKIFARSGTPFSVLNSRIPGALSASVGGNVLATLLDPNIQTSCGHANIDTPCFSTSQFATLKTQTNFGNLPRNAFRAPGYTDVDTSVYKTIAIHERAKFIVGASAFNVMNHPNFGSPASNVAVGGLGLISSTVTAPTSPYGAFQGSAVSGRVLVLTGKFQF
jgi:outer membrane receptor protein involved in Fe transport